MSCLRSIILLLPSCASIFLGSCQKSEKWQPTDRNLGSSVVDSLSDALSNEQKIHQLYADGALSNEATLNELRRYMPKTRQKYPHEWKHRQRGCDV